jgi:hypothetical protein
MHIQVALGLVTSTALAIFCIPFLRTFTEEKGIIRGVGLLHSIWLWQYHPDLSNLTRDIEHPAEGSLRTAGLIHFQLSRKHGVTQPKRKEVFAMSDSSSTGTRNAYNPMLVIH